jgi:hypothetical protein
MEETVRTLKKTNYHPTKEKKKTAVIYVLHPILYGVVRSSSGFCPHRGEGISEDMEIRNQNTQCIVQGIITALRDLKECLGDPGDQSSRSPAERVCSLFSVDFFVPTYPNYYLPFLFLSDAIR